MKKNIADIAIVGMACRFPGSNNYDQFWENLKEGKFNVTEIPKDRWDKELYYSIDKDAANSSVSKWGGFIEDADKFDARFFGISPLEAELMDPQQRIMLELAWNCFEDAGCLPSQLNGSNTGVYIGVCGHDYEARLEQSLPLIEGHMSTGVYTTIIPNRISYYFNFNGPSLFFDTACSSSLVAIHEAVQAMLRGDCGTALVGGVNILCNPTHYISFSKTGMLSPEGKCKTFDESANGYVRGEGAGFVYLKPLSDALDHEDHIHAVIKGASVNHGGKAQTLTSPNAYAQSKLIVKAWEQAGIPPQTIGYIEAHGTGTPKGDPIEANALKRAFSTLAKKHKVILPANGCGLGSVKTNIGHLESASGMAGLIKTILSIQNKQLPPIAHFKKLNPRIKLAKTPFHIVDKLQEWKACVDENGKDLPRRAGISSFGFGGVNAHLAIEEFPQTVREKVENKGGYTIILSARNEDRLKERAQNLKHFIQQTADLNLSDLSYTLWIGREQLNERLALVVASLKELEEKLSAFLTGQKKIENLYHGDEKSNRETIALFHSDEDSKQLTATWIEKKKYTKLMELWCKGLSLDWITLYGDLKYQRIPLPTYPFKKVRHWFVGGTRELSCDPLPTVDKSQQPEIKEVGTTPEESLEADLIDKAANILKTSRNEIDPNENLADFGFDSIGFSKLANSLTDHFGIEITPAMFFGYNTLKSLTDYFIKEHGELVQNLYQLDPKTTEVPAVSSDNRTFPLSSNSEPIAIIGMSGRFPGSRNIDGMWRIIAEGVNAVQEIPPGRLDWEPYYSEVSGIEGTTICKWSGLVPGVSEFDPLFFEIAPRNAELMDPKQRLILQELWNALEDAAYGERMIAESRIGVFVGVEDGDYRELVGTRGGITTNHNAILASGLSYFLNLSGPVLAINTACSSGLVAAHEACLRLRSGECDTAIAASANLMLSLTPYIGMSEAGMLSPDGKCHTFDTKANGMVPGEAVVAIVLKRLSQAEKNGDPIYATIIADGINYDGKTNGLTAPNGIAQAKLLREVYEKYQVNPEAIEYVVTHGTGTKLGDPVEVNALNEAFKTHTNKQGFCALTSTKTNFGHTLAASGLVSLISLVQALRHEMIPATLHCEQENEYIQWKESPFYINRENRPWPQKAKKNRVGAVSSFGMSGTNAHMVLQDYSANQTTTFTTEPTCYLLPLSAKTEEALQEKIKTMATFLKRANRTTGNLSQISHTLLEGRHHFKHRSVILVHDAQEAIQLWELSEKEKPANLLMGTVPDKFKEQKSIQRHIPDLLAQCRLMAESDTANSKEYREKLRTLAEFYCQGYTIPWDQLYGDIKPVRTHLPGYPFAKEQYWITDVADLQDNQNELLPAESETSSLLFLTPSWIEKAVEKIEAKNNTAFNRPMVLFCEMKKELVERVEQKMNGVRCLRLTSEKETIAERFQEYAGQLLQQVQGIFKEKKSGKTLLSLVIPSTPEQQLLFGLSGLLKTAETEHPAMIGQVIAVDPSDTAEEVITKLKENEHTLQEDRILYQNNRRKICQWKQHPVVEPMEKTPWKDHKVYLITGGTGGLGLIFAKEIAKRTKNSTLILTGRSSLNQEKIAELNSLKALGTNPVYKQADVNSQDAVSELIQNIQQEFGELHGIIHCAGIIRAGNLIDKSAAELQQVLLPKVSGVLKLDQASKNLDLDFFVLFSSISALGHPGLCDYAMANAFMDHFAEYRNTLVNANERQGKTISINWPLWKEGGMQLDHETETMIRETTGMTAMETETGLNAFYQSMAIGGSQSFMMEGDPIQLKRSLTELLTTVTWSTKGDKNEEYQNKLELLLTQTIAETLNTEVDQIDVDVELEEFGIDPVKLAEIAEILNQSHKLELTPTLFFDYPTISALAEFLALNTEQPEPEKQNQPVSKKRARQTGNKRVEVAGPSVIHPLLHWNSSDLSEQRYSATFTGKEFFLKDHRVKGIPVLPAVAQLEMVRAAIEKATAVEENDSILVRLKQVVWIRPIRIEEVTTIHIGIFPEANGELHWEIYAKPNKTEAEPIIYSQGIAIQDKLVELPTLNLSALKKECEQQVMNGNLVYERFTAMAFQYGPNFRAIEMVRIGSDKILTKLSLTPNLHRNQSEFLLNPGMTDSALQSSIALFTHGDQKTALPFALEELEIFGPFEPTMWALVRFSKGSSAEDRVQKIDVDICDDHGVVSARMVGFTTAVLEENGNTTTDAVEPKESQNKPTNTKAGERQRQEKTIELLKRQLASVLKIPATKIESEAAMEKYGIDSILAMTMINKLEETFGTLSKTLFFEYRNISELAQYFIKAHWNKLQPLLNLQTGETGSTAMATTPPADRFANRVVKTKKQRRRFGTGNPSIRKDVAIIGLSGRYPEAENIAEFWENLRSGKDCVTEIPKDRWDHSLYYDSEKGKPGKTYGKWGGFLKDVDKFDPLFFNISPRDALIMDPQERIFLQCTYETIEDAGYGIKDLTASQKSGRERRVGVYVGVMYNEYQFYGVQDTLLGQPKALYGSQASIANRISYYCDFNGPSLALDTMCSSSLTTIHFAFHSLLRGECDLAIAGGINISIHPNKYLLLGQGTFLSGEGRCESFGTGGDGYVPGEGVGAVLLKPLEKAEADNDHIYGVIKGTAINHGGKTNGYTVPNPNAQTNVIRDAFRESGINPRTISYIEAHGTGTALGDPIEITGLTNAFREQTEAKQFCAIGSAKSNIGHCEGAAGIGGVTKVLLQLKHGLLVPSLHSETLNPNIDFNETPFKVQQGLEEWKRPEIEINGVTKEYPRIAGISSFGAGGANAHVLIEEYRKKEASQTAQKEQEENHLILLSAKSKKQLNQIARNLHDRLQQPFHDSLANVAYTLQVGRAAMEIRLALLVNSLNELTEKLEAFLNNQNRIENFYQGDTRKDGENLNVFLNDEDSKEIIEKWIKKRKLPKLGEIWVKGAEIDWNRLYDENTPGRISLPTYPFAKERYWAPDDSAKKLDPTGALATLKSTEKPVEFETLFPEPYWSEDLSVEKNSPTHKQQLVILCEIDAITPQEVESKIKGARCLNLQAKGESIEQRFERYALLLLDAIQTLLKDDSNHKVPVRLLCNDKGESSLFAGLDGLLKTAGKENPKLIPQLILVESKISTEELLTTLTENERYPMQGAVRYQKGKRQIAGWKMPEHAPTNIKVLWEEQKVYLITGGAGGLGLIFAEDIVQKVKKATLILTGRSELNKEKEDKLQALQKQGATIQYRQVDVTDEESVKHLIQDIVKEFGQLNGIIHSAGVIRDSFILKKSPEDFRMVLAPKVSGSIYLDRATQKLNLDFFVLFSSLSGMGNAGQSDYAAGNAFMDRFAEYRNRLLNSGQRFGRTLSINWPLWKEGGMHVDEKTEKMLLQSTGMTPLKSKTGINALYRAMATGKSQVAVVAGNSRKIQKELFAIKQSHSLKTERQLVAPETSEALKDAVSYKIKVLVGKVLKLGVDRIEGKEPLENYGIDSVVIGEINQEFEKRFPDVSKTLFFEHRTLESMTGYFIQNYQEECQEWTGLNKSSEPLPEEKGEVKTTIQSISPVPVQPDLQIPQRENEPIAIIGLSGRYPEAENTKEFWENLKVGKNSVTEIPEDRWSLEGFYTANKQEAVEQGKSYSKWGGFLDGCKNFDPLFFKISPREAVNMDPQERLFVESCWEVLEDAGYTVKELETKFNRQVGVFAGITKTGFNLYGPELWKQGEQAFPYTSFSSVANRVSWLLNLQGPSMPIDTMCSSSLTAIHEACEQLRLQNCEMAIAGGVNLYLHPSTYTGLCSQTMLSVDGLCKSFGKGGNGFVPGEGVGTVLLKTLSNAIQDQDHIYALVRGSSVNHGGKTSGYTVPNPIAQGESIRKALDRAGIDARMVSYIEAHGTGTELGDPVEITGLNHAFNQDTASLQFCAIGSVKSNIGHLEAAAGIAGVTKIVFQMKHQKIVPSLHATELNPNINFAKTPFVLQRELTDWKRPMIEQAGELKEIPRIAGISSFGAGGSNAHMVLEEYIDNKPKQDHENRPTLIPLSAKNERQLKEMAKNLSEFVQTNKALRLSDIAYTLQTGRESMEQRLAVIVNSIEELIEAMTAYTENQDAINNLYQGHIQGNRSAMAAFETDESLKMVVDQWIREEKLTKLADFWVQGLNLDWSQLNEGTDAARISLPTYPFAREHYWLPEIKKEAEPSTGKTATAMIHPLLHQNSSNLSELRFTSTFTGTEPLLSKQGTKAQRTLPAATCLEMARAAVLQVAEKETIGQLRLSDIVWGHAFMVGTEPNDLHIALFQEANEQVAYEIYSHGKNSGENTSVHNRGIASFDLLTEKEPLNPEALKEENQTTPVTITATQKEQGIEAIYQGNDYLLAKLTSPIEEKEEQFQLQPNLIMSALQAADFLTPIKSNTPIAMEELEIRKQCNGETWAFIRPGKEKTDSDQTGKFDIDLCDNTGTIALTMQGVELYIDNQLIS